MIDKNAVPDHFFPPLVVIDLEVDFLPGALRGTRVFEVAAIRYQGERVLDSYHSFIKRDFRPVKGRSGTNPLTNAPTEEQVASALRGFIGTSIVVGHKLRTFDAPELRGMEVEILQGRIFDTLELARMLHPDSLYHNLPFLCHQYHIDVDKSKLHTALYDAELCGKLLYRMGNKLAVRDKIFLQSIRALTSPDSNFDKIILQPRNIPADSTLKWELLPTPTVPDIITKLRGNPVSCAMRKVIQTTDDYLVEHTDFDACYVQTLTTGKRNVIVTASHKRVEHIVVGCINQSHKIFILPHPQTLLCPSLMREAIVREVDSDMKLHLFCLYQASHNHDAATLYPLRLPDERPEKGLLHKLKEVLLDACCANNPDHWKVCPARQAVNEATTQHTLVLSTHENLFAWPALRHADTIVIDDIASLQMHLAEYTARTLTSNQLKRWLIQPAEQEIYEQLETKLLEYAQAYLPEKHYHARLSLSSFMPYLQQNKQESLLLRMSEISAEGQRIATLLQQYFTEATQQPATHECLHVYWLDLRFTTDKQGHQTLQQWSICGINQPISEGFLHWCWKPYSQHILAGPALSIGDGNTHFLRRSLGIPRNLPFIADARTKKQVYLPSPETMPPTSYLQQRQWIMQVGALLAAQAQKEASALLITLNNKTAADALLETACKVGNLFKRQLLATQLDWTTTKINERLQDPTRQLLVFASPQQRQTFIESDVDVEISGPLRFLNRQDPLVAAYMQFFAHHYAKEGPFNAYLLPQALLELKTALTSSANTHIICDGGLLASSYRDEVFQLLADDAEVHELICIEAPCSQTSDSFLDKLGEILSLQELHHQASISDAELQLILRSVWDTDEFRRFPALEGSSKPAVTHPRVAQRDKTKQADNKSKQRNISQVSMRKRGASWEAVEDVSRYVQSRMRRSFSLFTERKWHVGMPHRLSVSNARGNVADGPSPLYIR